MNDTWRFRLGAMIALGIFFAAMAMKTSLARSEESEPVICGPMASVVKALREEFRQNITAVGHLANGATMLVASEPGGGFTVLVVGNGVACVAFLGVGLEFTGVAP